MANPLRDRNSPGKLAELGQVVEKQIKLEDLPGLAEVLAKDLSTLDPGEVPQEWRQAPVAIRLTFGWADRGRRLPALEGRIAARVPAVCQRCLGPMQLALDEELKFLLVGADEAASAQGVTDDHEVWEIEDATIRPLDILEEALIMAMPLSTVHGAGEGCGAPDETVVPESDETIRPFAGLRSTLYAGDTGNGNES